MYQPHFAYEKDGYVFVPPGWMFEMDLSDKDRQKVADAWAAGCDALVTAWKRKKMQKKADGDLIIEKPGGKLTKDDVETAFLVLQDYLKDRRQKMVAANDKIFAHNVAGSLTNKLLMGLLGAGVGAGAHALGVGSSDLKHDALVGGAAGVGTAALADLLGMAWGKAKRVGTPAAASRAWEKDIDNHIAGKTDTWKKYLIPGYAGYKLGLY